MIGSHHLIFYLRRVGRRLVNSVANCVISFRRLYTAIIALRGRLLNRLNQGEIRARIEANGNLGFPDELQPQLCKFDLR